MPTIPVAQIIPGPKYKITPKASQDASGLFMLGNTDPENAVVGAYSIHFVMSTDWVGSIGVLGRSGLVQAGEDDIALLGPWPFRAFVLNGTSVDPSVYQVGTSAIITSTSNILVPGYGQTIGLLAACTVGSCTMYYTPLLGQSAV